MTTITIDESSSTLSKRGAAFASGPNIRDMAKIIMGPIWNPVTNPDAIINVGTAENVRTETRASVYEEDIWSYR